MNFFTIDPKKIIAVLVLVGVPLLAINTQRGPGESSSFMKPFSLLTGVAQHLYFSFSSGVRGSTALYLELVGTNKENRQLQKQNAEYRAQLGALTELKLENERLNQLLGFKKKTNMELLAAKVIGRDLIPDHGTITINRGTDHGIKKNMAAITIGGVVGYVIQPETYTSQILLLTDRYAAIDTIVQRSRSRGIVEGVSSRDTFKLRYLQRGDDVQVGDLVVTSGLDNVFPKGFPVGMVTQVKKSRYGMSQDVDLKPAINPFNLEEVFVVLNANQEDFEREQVPPAEAPTDESKESRSTADAGGD